MSKGTAAPLLDDGRLRSWLPQQPWCCPRCRSALSFAVDETVCKSCRSRYEVFDGIADLRLPGESWIDYEEDRRLARRFIAQTGNLPLAEQLAWCFSARNDFTPEQIRIRVGQVLSAVDHLGEQIDHWLGQVLVPNSLSLDLGCGPGQLIAAASRKQRTVVGIDVRLLWLLAAKRLITSFGGTPVLAAALAEHMPLADGSIQSVVSLDVIEHVTSVPNYLKEIDRVTASGGFIALSTPNRFSLAAEPHVGVWGVGWVPRKWQQQYVMMRKGIPYPYTCLLSAPETLRLIKRHTGFAPRLIVPEVAKHEIERFAPYRKSLARLYNRLGRLKAMRLPLLAVGPFFRVIAQKRSDA